MKEKTPKGKYFSYDEKSRKTGKSMLLPASRVTGIAIILRLRDLDSHYK